MTTKHTIISALEFEDRTGLLVEGLFKCYVICEHGSAGNAEHSIARVSSVPAENSKTVTCWGPMDIPDARAMVQRLNSEAEA